MSGSPQYFYLLTQEKTMLSIINSQKLNASIGNKAIHLLKAGYKTGYLAVMGILLSAFLLASCASTGTDFNSDNVKKLKPGMTEEQVINLLGAKPMQRTKTGKGQEYMLSWAYSSAYALPFGIGTKSKAKGLIITFDGNKKMKEITSETNM